MNDFLKWTGKQGMVAVLWVFILSITIEGRTLFSHAHNVLVQNTFVAMLDEELASLWTKVYQTARTTFNSLSGADQKT